MSRYYSGDPVADAERYEHDRHFSVDDEDMPEPGYALYLANTEAGIIACGLCGHADGNLGLVGNPENNCYAHPDCLNREEGDYERRMAWAD